MYEALLAYFLYFALVRDFLEALNDGKFLHFRTWLIANYSIAGIILQYMKARIQVLLVYPTILFVFIYLTLGLFDCLSK
jgi:hypothetical protein